MTDVTNSVLVKKARDQGDDDPIAPEPVSIKEDLTIIKGIGKSVAEKLFQAGITSIHELALASKEHLIRIQGIGAETAIRFINAAKSSINTPTLNAFTGSNPKRDLSAQGNEQEYTHSISPEKSKEQFHTKFNKPQSGVWYPPNEGPPEKQGVESTTLPVPPHIEDGDEPFEGEEVQKYDRTPENRISEKPSSPTIIVGGLSFKEAEIHSNKERIKTHDLGKLTSGELEAIKAEVQKELTSRGYYIIHSNPLLNNIFKGFDLIGVLTIEVNELLDLLLLVPIKINPIKGPLIVSENSVECNFSQETKRQYNRTISTLHNANLDKIIQSQEAIFNELVSEGALFQFFKKYLKLNIAVEKTITSKRLFFRSGALQQKILIEPVLINHGEVGFIEKVLPFAYHKSTNLHIIERKGLSSLLPYLQKKYYLLETQQTQESSLTRYFSITASLMEELRLYSIPFIGFGIIFAFILLSQVPDLIQLFMNVGVGLLIIYSMVAGYLYYKFYKKKIELQQEFHTPYYLQLPTLDETSLILINEEFSSELMSQFSYECLGKDIPFSFLVDLEKGNMERTPKIRPEIEKKETFIPKESDSRNISELNFKTKKQLFFEDIDDGN